MLMRPLWLCLFALWSGPALSQAARTSRGGSEHAGHRHSHVPHSRGAADAVRPGLAPGGFSYRCDAPPGYYPFVLACQAPWQMVMSPRFGFETRRPARTYMSRRNR